MQPDVHDVRVAEEVVEITEGFLVGADEESGEIVLLAVLQLVLLQGPFDVT